MHALSLYMNPHGSSALHDSGFSWLAAILPLLWALNRRLYKTAIAVYALQLAVNPLMALAVAALPEGIGIAAGLLGFGALVYMQGRWAYRWHRHVLQREAYVLIATDRPDGVAAQ